MTTPRLRTSRRPLSVVGIAALCLLLLPSTASAAGHARVSNGTLTYDGGAEDNQPTLSWDGDTYTLTDWGAGTVAAGAGCSSSSGPAGPMPIVTCDGGGVDAILIRTGGGNDVAQVEVGTVLPAGVRLTVQLGDGADSWSGSRATADIVHGGAGNDTIEGYGGRDKLHDDGGNDTIDGGAGNDRISGGSGADTLRGTVGNDTVYGQGGKDHLYGNAGRDTLRGGDGNDYLSGGLGADRMAGDAGNDRLLDDHRGQAKPSRSADVLVGGPGRDTADYSYRLGEATPLRLSLDGRANDGAKGEDDKLADTVENIIGGIRSDVIIGSAARNVLRGLEGNDVIRGRGGNDRLHGDSGGDRLEGGAGADVLEGWWGEDTVIGGSGTDVLRGGVDDDVLKADDRSGDEVSCGGGRDRAVVDSRDVFWLCERVVRR